MATVDKTSRVRNVAEASRRVRDPLQKLRGYIRLYVSLEAAAIAILFVAACFWISLALDYGAFKIPFLSIDWVQKLHWSVRVALLVVFVLFLLAIIASKAVIRLLQRFRDAALALELERRFPKILGDRLITAIELSNRRKIIEQGYSPAMVDETIVEAAERVEKLPLKEVFRWGRLWSMAAIIFAATVVLYLLTAAGFCAAESYSQGHTTLAGFNEFHEVATIWFERNVLLRDTIWPRRAYLVVLEPDTDNLRLGRDKQSPSIRVRALKYVVADPKTSEGWRALTWKDLKDKKHLIGGEPAVAPEDWKLRDQDAGLTVDEVDLLFAKFDIRKGVDGKPLPFTWAVADNSEAGWRPLAWKDLTGDYLTTTFRNDFQVPKLPAKWPAPLDPALGHSIDEVVKEMDKEDNHNDPALGDIRNVLAHLDRLDAMRRTLDKVDRRAADGGLRRTMRKLIVPLAVDLTVKGPTTSNTMTLTKMPDNEFTGTFGELKEKAQSQWKFRYYARGEDYYTQDRYLIVVPPPTLSKLEREELRPAYLYYRVGGLSNVKVEDVKGQKQPIERTPVSLMSGDVVLIDFPAGTDLTLIGEADKELNDVQLFEPKGGPQIKKDVKIEGRTFQVTFEDVRQDLTFDVKLIDRDNVEGLRAIKLRPTHDSEPSVDVAIAEWVRKTKDGYMVTPRARIPFSGSIKDDYGLSKVQYVYTVAKIESTAVLDVKALYTSGAVSMIAPQGCGVLHGTTFLAAGLHEYETAKSAQTPGSKDVKYYPGPNESIKRFAETLEGQVSRAPERAEFLARAKVHELLAKPQSASFRSLFKDFKVDPDPLSKDLKPDEFFTDFPLASANLAASEGKTQLRYRVTLWVEATDNDLDSTKERDGVAGPKIGTSKERYPLLVVSDDDLIVEIAKDEEKLSTDMSIMFDKLLDIQSKLATINLDLGGGDLKPENLGPMSVRTEALEQTLDSAQATTREVLMKYQAIFRELKGNQVEGKKMTTVAKYIIAPLEEIDSDEFDNAKRELQTLRKELDSLKADNFGEVVSRSKAAGGKSREQMQILIDKVRGVMENMTKEIQLNKVIEALRKLEQEEEKNGQLIKQIRDDLERRLLEGSLKP
jgi:hypothetical protein